MLRFILLHDESDLLLRFKAMEKEMHFIDSLVRMPVAAEPGYVVGAFFDSVEPLLGDCVHGALVLFSKTSSHPTGNRECPRENTPFSSRFLLRAI
jgi:hypothetical protein